MRIHATSCKDQHTHIFNLALKYATCTDGTRMQCKCKFYLRTTHLFTHSSTQAPSRLTSSRKCPRHYQERCGEPQGLYVLWMHKHGKMEHRTFESVLSIPPLLPETALDRQPQIWEHEQGNQCRHTSQGARLRPEERDWKAAFSLAGSELGADSSIRESHPTPPAQWAQKSNKKDRYPVIQ